MFIFHSLHSRLETKEKYRLVIPKVVASENFSLQSLSDSLNGVSQKVVVTGAGRSRQWSQGELRDCISIIFCRWSMRIVQK